MTNSLTVAEGMVRRLIARANRSHVGASLELRAHQRGGQHRGGVGTRQTHTLRIHPCWLRYVVAQGEFQCCVADEIEAWYLLERLTAEGDRRLHPRLTSARAHHALP